MLRFLRAAVVLLAGARPAVAQSDDAPQWLAGDHHIHSRFSVDLDESTEPPTPEVDSRGEDPCSDLWFYANPIFLEVK